MFVFSALFLLLVALRFLANALPRIALQGSSILAGNVFASPFDSSKDPKNESPKTPTSQEDSGNALDEGTKYSNCPGGSVAPLGGSGSSGESDGGAHHFSGDLSVYEVTVGAVRRAQCSSTVTHCLQSVTDSFALQRTGSCLGETNAPPAWAAPACDQSELSGSRESAARGRGHSQGPQTCNAVYSTAMTSNGISRRDTRGKERQSGFFRRDVRGGEYEPAPSECRVRDDSRGRHGAPASNVPTRLPGTAGRSDQIVNRPTLPPIISSLQLEFSTATSVMRSRTEPGAPGRIDRYATSVERAGSSTVYLPGLEAPTNQTARSRSDTTTFPRGPGTAPPRRTRGVMFWREPNVRELRGEKAVPTLPSPPSGPPMEGPTTGTGDRFPLNPFPDSYSGTGECDSVASNSTETSGSPTETPPVQDTSHPPADEAENAIAYSDAQDEQTARFAENHPRSLRGRFQKWRRNRRQDGA